MGQYYDLIMGQGQESFTNSFNTCWHKQLDQMPKPYRALSKINADYSKVLYLKFFEDLNNEQIAMVLKKNRRQIENMIYQAKQALKSELDKEGVNANLKL